VNAQEALKLLEYDPPPRTLAPCAWCQAEMGVRPSAGESHTICARHASELLATPPPVRASWARARVVAILVGAFALGLLVGGAAAGVEVWWRGEL
jgi:hypothetical protein